MDERRGLPAGHPSNVPGRPAWRAVTRWLARVMSASIDDRTIGIGRDVWSGSTSIGPLAEGQRFHLNS